MEHDALQITEKYTKAHQRKKRWYRVVTGMACVVVFCTVYALILPAITLEKAGCGIPEHAHTQECYTQVTSVQKTVPVCNEDMLALHRHTSDCYDVDGNQICGYSDFIVHEHDASCYDKNGKLWCPLPEIETHTHDADCYTVPEAENVHTHSDACYTLERGALICTEHVHTDGCYTETTIQICGLEESDGHQHDESCMDENGEIVCEIEPSEGHYHNDSCYETIRELTCSVDSDHQHTDDCYAWEERLICELPTGPVEEKAEPELICEKKEVILHTHQPYVSPENPGCYDEHGHLVCGQVQILAHQHTVACFDTVEEPVDTEVLTCTSPEDENHTHTALCYGTWVLTCSLEEHIHSEECTPADPEPVYVCGKEAHTHSETCYDEAGELICGLEEHTHSEECQETDTPAEDQILTAAGEDYTVSVMPGPESGLPENIELTVTEIAEGSEDYETYFLQAEQALQQAGSAGPLVFARFFDVKLISGGEPVEPAAPVSVSITYADMEGLENADCHAVHFTEEGVELLEATAEKSENGDVSVTHIQSSFSVVGNVVTQAEDYSISAYTDAPTTGLNHNVTFMVKIRDNWVNVGSCTYDTSAVGDRNASVSSDVLRQYLNNYGYSKESDPANTLKCSYDDIYTIYYAQNGAATDFALDIPDASITEGAFLQLWTANQSAAQIFRIWRVVDDYYFITPLSNSSLHVNLEEGSIDNETKLWLHSALDEASWWGIRNNDDGTVSFYSKKKNTAFINLAGNNQNDGTAIQLYETDGDNRWKLVQKYDEQTVVTIGDRVGLTAESNGNIVCFYTPSTPLDDPNAIYTAEELSKLGTSGNYYLGCDITVNKVIGQAADIGDGVSSTLDLKGHTIHYNVPTSENGNSMIYLHGTGSLTITDSGQPVETTEVVTDQTLYGNQARYDSSTKTLIYYVTESHPNGDATTEKLVKHTVDLSNVGTVCSETTPNQFFFVADSASLNIQGGLFTNPDGLRVASAVGSSNINISGGYLCGCVSNNDYGGAISSDSAGALTISGGVIAGNQAGKGGGVYKRSGTFTMTGGVISGNVLPENTVSSKADDFGKGGGVFLESVSSVFSGGYITNNRVDYYCGNAGEGHHFGGGIAQYGSTLTMENGAYLTGNYHHEAGGGIGFNGDKLIMTGGTVAANVAQNAEGGGIRIQESSQTSLISGGYITNNRTNSMHDWGGGGIFVSQGQSMQILNAVFQKNSADGFGGGVGGCSTGQIVAVDNTVGGVAIFDNYANGRTMSGSDGHANVKQDDLTARSNEVFMTNGYNDFFCALNSAVSGTMLGGGAENWHGSRDYEEIDIDKDQVVTANKMMGLNASPSDADKQKAIQNGTVFVSGNYSQTHGGGIMSNGILILGQAQDISLSPGLEIEVYKSFKDTNGNELDQQPGQFQFLLQDEDRNTIATVSNNTYGMVLAEQDYTEAGTYTYYLKEQIPAGESLITYDETEYQINVTVGTDKKELNLSANQSMIITYYVVKDIQVSLSSGTGTVSTETSNVGSDNHRATVVIKKDGGTAFTNTMNEKPLYFRITKLNGHTNEPLQFVEFKLKDESGKVVTSGKTDKDGHVSLQIEKGKSYRLYETTYKDFMPAGPWILEVDTCGNVTIYETTTAADGSINKSDAGTACAKDEKDVAVYYDHTITNLIGGYELPDTGGAGTIPYTAGGLLLMAAAMNLLYSHTKRRKEDAPSS